MREKCIVSQVGSGAIEPGASEPKNPECVYSESAREEPLITRRDPTEPLSSQRRYTPEMPLTPFDSR